MLTSLFSNGKVQSGLISQLRLVLNGIILIMISSVGFMENYEKSLIAV